VKFYIFLIAIILIFTNGAYSLDFDKDRFREGIPNSLLDGFITSISHNENNIYVGSWDGIFIYDIKNKKWKSGSDYRGDSPLFITALHIADSNEIYIGTSYSENSGLYKLENNLITKIVIEEDKSMNITSIYKLKDKLYVGTFGNGLYIKENGNFKKSEVKGKFFTSISGIGDKIYAATKYKGIYYIRDNDDIEVIDEHSSNIPNNSVSNVCFRDSNEIWIGTWGGASRVKNEKWTTFFKYEKQLLNSNVKCITYDKNSVYLGTDKGISIYNNNENFVNISLDKYPLPSNNILSLCKTENYLWVGTDKGLIKIGNTK